MNKDYFLSQEDCDKSQKTYINTNPRYKNFFQDHFTAGDEDQFEQNIKRENVIAYECQTKIMFDIPYEIPYEIYHKYQNLKAQAVINTFRYIFHKFKKGIFIQIRNNKLITFLPFSKAKFMNEWSDMIKIDPKFENIVEFMRHVNDLENRPFKEKKVNRFPSGWYANNCLVRYEFPISEGDTGTHHIKNMFEELCENREICDIDLFINRRDFPLLKKDETEPYNHIWNTKEKKLISHNYSQYVPILSSVSSDELNFADIPIPTIEDWARVRASEGVVFPKTGSRQYLGNFDKPWEERKCIVVFRGGSTGCGVTIETNPRLKAAYISSLDQKDEKDGLPYLDCGITDWNLRPRKIEGEKYLKTIEIQSLPFGLVKKLTPEEQTNYKYILHIDGHVSAFRLSLELNMGSVLLIVDSPYQLWFKKMLKPYIHYVPVKRDLSDLIEKVKWCKENDEKCKEIVKNAKTFYMRYLSKDGVFDYLTQLIYKLNKNIGGYEYSTMPLTKQLKKEEEWFIKFLENNKKYQVPVFGFPMLNHSRDYYRYSALSNFIFEHKLSFREIIQKTKLSTISLCEVSGVEFVVKSSKDKKKMNENIHEAFIGINQINHLLKHIPNFLYTFSALKFDDCVSVISEKIEGVNMLSWLKSDDYNFEDFKLIIAQLCLALHVAQKTCSFVHYDLYPWNIIIQRIDEAQDIEYVINSKKVIRIRTDIIPIIIDYGKSHVIDNSEHYGFINMFCFSKIQDIMTIIFSSISQICEKGGDDNKEYIRLVNFFTGNKCFPKRINSFSQLKHFVLEKSSFTNMISMEKFDLEEKSVMDFFEFLNYNNINISEKRMTKKHGFISVQQHIDFILKASSGNRRYRVKNFPTSLKEKLYVYYYFQNLNDKRYFKNFKEMLEKAIIIKNKYESLKNVNARIQLRDDFTDGEDILLDKNLLDIDISGDFEIIDMILTYSGIFEVNKKDREEFMKEIEIDNHNYNHRENIASENAILRYFHNN